MKKLIKSVTRYTQTLLTENSVSESLEPVIRKNIHTAYYPSGNVRLQIIFNEREEEESRFEYIYDLNNLLIEEITHDETGSVIEKKCFERDGNGKICFEKKFYQEGEPDIITYCYDETGSLISRETRDEEDDLLEKEVFEYENGKLVLEKKYNEKEKPILEKTITSNENERIVELNFKSPEENYRLITSYNEKGNQEKICKYDNTGRLVERTLYFEDDNGRVIEMEEETAYLKNTTRFSYDGFGNVIMEEEINKNGLLTQRVEREYDEMGNIVTSHVFIDGHGVSANRQYTYRFVYEFYD